MQRKTDAKGLPSRPPRLASISTLPLEDVSLTKEARSGPTTHSDPQTRFRHRAILRPETTVGVGYRTSPSERSWTRIVTVLVDGNVSK